MYPRKNVYHVIKPVLNVPEVMALDPSVQQARDIAKGIFGLRHGEKRMDNAFELRMRQIELAKMRKRAPHPHPMLDTPVDPEYMKACAKPRDGFRHLSSHNLGTAYIHYWPCNAQEMFNSGNAHVRHDLEATRILYDSLPDGLDTFSRLERKQRRQLNNKVRDPKSSGKKKGKK